ncbi:MAG: protein translocase SEC61 complex subunit gamma [Candidatus Hodarchaeales archaeon]|jgi:protein translocase SEC61 complex gamma subunit
MGMFADMTRLMKIATKPDRREIWLVIRVTALGMGFLGLIGFVIKIAADTIISSVVGT